MPWHEARVQKGDMKCANEIVLRQRRNPYATMNIEIIPNQAESDEKVSLSTISNYGGYEILYPHRAYKGSL